MIQRNLSHLFIGLLLSAPTAALAQQPSGGQLKPVDRSAILHRQFRMELASGAARTTGTAFHYRLVGYTSYNPQTGVLEDTGRYHYSGKRESRFVNELENLEGYRDMMPSKPDSALCITEHGMFEERNDFTYDGTDRVTSWAYAGFDQIFYKEFEYSTPTGPYTLSRHYAAVNGQTVHQTNTTYRYLPGHDSLLASDSTYDLTLHQPVNKTVCSYDGSRLHWQSSRAWDENNFRWHSAHDSVLNTYDVNGQLIYSSLYVLGTVGGLVAYKQHYFVYDVQGRLIEDITRLWDGMFYRDEERVTYSYTLSKRLYTGMITYRSELNSIGNPYWKPLNQYSYTLNGAGQWKECTMSHWLAGGWQNTGLQQFSYNIHDLIDEVLERSWNVQLNDFDLVATRHRVYQYDYFTTTTAVDAAVKQEGSVRVFPNPARSFVQIRLDQALEAAVFLTDASGRCLVQSRTNASGQLQLSLENVPAGLYSISVLDPKGQSLGTMKVVKL